jgi:hypothetical protein
MIEDLKELNKQLAYKMMNVIRAENADTKIKMNHLGPRLVFPLSRGEKVRISEQESKIIFCSVLNNTNYYYSVETPTKEGYSFSGSKDLSARSDLSIYTVENDSLIKKVNVELKSGNPEIKSISKDIEKLIREKYLGNWVHTLESVRSNTLSTLFKKFILAFNGKHEDETYDGSNLPHINKAEKLNILFSFLIIGEKKIAIMKLFELPNADRENYISNFFKIEYKDLIEQPNKENYGWEIIEFKNPDNNNNNNNI